MKKLCIISLISLSLPLTAQAFSLFSGNGFGELIPPLDAKSKGMGGVGMASPDRGDWDINPSLLRSFTGSTLSLTLNSEYSDHKDPLGDARTFAFRLANLRFALPLPHGVVSGVSVRKRFDMDFDMVDIPGSVDTIGYTRSIASRGGIYSTSIALARGVGDRISLGGSFNFLSGSGTEEWTTEFANPEIRTSLDSLKHSFTGWNATFGLLGRFARGVSFGASVTTPTSLDTELEVVYPAGSDSEDRTYSLPPIYAAGVAYTVLERLRLASDLRVYPWSSLSVDGESSGGFINAYRFAIGVHLIASSDELDPLWQKVPIRIGYNRSPWYFETEGGTIEEQFITLGSSLSLASGEIDLSVELGERKGGDLRERLLRGGITLTGWEKW